MRISQKLLRTAVATAILACLAIPGLAHHGFGLFQLDIKKEWSGTLTQMNLVNPHSYMELDVVDENGRTLHMRCEMRAATLIRRSGWSTDMFKVGAHVEIEGSPHRDDLEACYIENFTIDDSIQMNRNDQFVSSTPVDTSNRSLRLADGQPNIGGDWAVEQLVLTVPPSGGNGSMIPRSMSPRILPPAQLLLMMYALLSHPGRKLSIRSKGSNSSRCLRQTLSPGQSLVCLQTDQFRPGLDC